MSLSSKDKCKEIRPELVQDHSCQLSLCDNSSTYRPCRDARVEAGVRISPHDDFTPLFAINCAVYCKLLHAAPATPD